MNQRSSLPKIYRDKFVGQSVSHVWNGYGSALFLEFGNVSPTFRRDGSQGNGNGELGLMVQWGWRIEHKSTIICGSSSENVEWAPAFARLIGQSVIDLSFSGHLPEIAVYLDSDFRLLSFMDASGDPEWTLFDRRSAPSRWLHVKDGHFREDVSEKGSSQER